MSRPAHTTLVSGELRSTLEHAHRRMDFADSRRDQEESESCYSLRDDLRGEENEQKGEHVNSNTSKTPILSLPHPPPCANHRIDYRGSNCFENRSILRRDEGGGIKIFSEERHSCNDVK